jgi:hypothetical protein
MTDANKMKRRLDSFQAANFSLLSSQYVLVLTKRYVQ